MYCVATHRNMLWLLSVSSRLWFRTVAPTAPKPGQYDGTLNSALNAMVRDIVQKRRELAAIKPLSEQIIAEGKASTFMYMHVRVCACL